MEVDLKARLDAACSGRTTAGMSSHRQLSLTRLIRPSRWSAAFWAFRALRHARRELVAVGVRYSLDLPMSSGEGQGAVELALRLGRASCLERAVVLQAWGASRGQEHEVVVGVVSVDGEVRAHAWLDGEGAANLGYRELIRLPARPSESR